MRRGKSESARVAAACAVLDRAWGKPPQALEHTGPEGERLIPHPDDLVQLPDASSSAWSRSSGTCSARARATATRRPDVHALV
jgi:hypothetical protein